MSIESPKKLKHIGTYSALEKTRRARKVARQEARANERLRVARLASEMRKNKMSWRKIEEMVEAMQRAGELRKDYSHETIRNLAAKYNAGATSSAHHMDQPRAGRPYRMPGVLLDIITKAILTNEALPITDLWHKVKATCDALKIDVPSYDTVKRAVARQGRTALNAGRFGVREAEMTGVPHSTVPARWPHDVWTVDEFDAPFYCRIYDPQRAEWCSVRPIVVLVADHRSGVILGYWLADPSRRRDRATGEMMRAGFDTNDVLAALLSAAWGRELATPGTAAFTGWMPRTIRWDNHSTHASLRPILEQLGERLAVETASFHKASEDQPMTSFSEWHETDVEEPTGATYSDLSVGIIVPKLPRYRPINRGKIEKTVGMAKALLRHVHAHVDRVTPMDRLDVLPKQRRDVAVGAGSREFRRVAIKVERLPTIEEGRAMIDAGVYRFNHEQTVRRLRMTRHAKYRMEFDQMQARPGVDLLAALDTKSTFVTETGIVHHHDGGETTFAFQVDGKYALLLDTPVDYKPDPLLRGAWLRVERAWHWVRTKFEWALEPGRAEEAARQAKAQARYYAAEAAHARDAQTDELYGPGAAADDAKTAANTVETRRKAESEAAQADAAAARAAAGAAASRTETPPAPPPNAGTDSPAQRSRRTRLDLLRDDSGHEPHDAVG